MTGRGEESVVNKAAVTHLLDKLRNLYPANRQHSDLQAAAIRSSNPLWTRHHRM